MEKRGPPDHNDALKFNSQIKTQFAARPEIYKQYLEILRGFVRHNTPLRNVYSRIVRLFDGAPDLVEELKYFLPESAAQAEADENARRQTAESAGTTLQSPTEPAPLPVPNADPSSSASSPASSHSQRESTRHDDVLCAFEDRIEDHIDIPGPHFICGGICEISTGCIIDIGDLDQLVLVYEHNTDNAGLVPGGTRFVHDECFQHMLDIYQGTDVRTFKREIEPDQTKFEIWKRDMGFFDVAEQCYGKAEVPQWAFLGHEYDKHLFEEVTVVFNVKVAMRRNVTCANHWLEMESENHQLLEREFVRQEIENGRRANGEMPQEQRVFSVL